MRSYFPLMIAIFSASIVVSGKNVFHYFNSEGNEIRVARKYFSLTNQSFNEIEYYGNVQSCFSKTLSYLLKCLRTLHGNVFNKNGVLRRVRQGKDCNYKISSRFLKMNTAPDENITYYNYHFLIEQDDCLLGWQAPDISLISTEQNPGQRKNSSSNVFGGSSFIVTAYDENHLVSCRSKDLLNSKYHLSCEFRRRPQEAKQYSCINMTVLLEYEHFEGFGESLTGVTTPYLQNDYNSIRQVITDNKQFCFEGTNEIAQDQNKFSQQNELRNILIISGEWISKRLCDNLSLNECSMYLNSSNIQAYDHHKMKNELSNLAKGQLIYNASFPEISRFENAKSFSENYLFHPIFHTLSSDMTLTLISSPELYSIKFTPFIKSQSVHFVGSSHIRFSFDSITELYNLGYMTGGYTSVENMKSYHAGEDFSSVFSDDQADGLGRLCNSFKSNPNLDYFIVFMTGAWDLSFTPIRRIFHDSNTGSKLVNVIKRIIEGSLECPGLKKFIFLTEIPYSPCYDDNDSMCKLVKGFRTNSAIAALNEFYMSSFLNLNVKEGLEFTIIDAYSIISPRLQLLPDVEYDCNFHYHCKQYTHSREPMTPLQLGHTPGGDAMVRAILLALSSKCS